MNLLEYEAKSILTKFSIPTPKSVLFHRGDPLLIAPVVLKSQVHTGGRGKAGGVVVVRDQAEVEHTAHDILRLEINNEKPVTLLAEEVLDIVQEYYLSLTINRVTAESELIAHNKGGIDIESHSESEFLRKPITKQNTQELGSTLAEYYGIPGQEFALQELLSNLYTCFTSSDCLLLEINPLILTEQGALVAGDCKMTLDDDASFRHTDWRFEQAPSNANFVTLDAKGTVATIANGAGLAMATVDAVKQVGLTPANFLDIGGGATVETIVASFQKIIELPNIDTIIINIFGGIVRCDDVAAAILEARKQFKSLPTLYIRLSGNRSSEAAALLEEVGLQLYPDLPSTLAEVLHG